MSGGIRSSPLLASTAVQRLTARSRRLRRWFWPSTDDALARRRDGAIALDAAYRALTGGAPAPAERSALLEQAKSGLGFDEMIGRLRRTDRFLAHDEPLATQSVRDRLERDIRLEAALGAATANRLIFLHIMKTGGTSLSQTLRKWAGESRSRVGIPLDDLAVLSRPQLSRLRAVSGHLPFEVLDLMPESWTTATVLRDPVRRTVSHYRELRRTSVPHRDLSLDEFISSEVYAVPSGNYQARALAHSIDLASAWIGYSPRRRYLEAGGDPDQPNPLQSLFDSTPIEGTGEELLRAASANLDRIDLVGVTEELDQLGARIGALFGVTGVQLPTLNASEGPPPDVPRAIRKRIEARTEIDRELYRQALRISRRGGVRR
ncbi:MAG: hypothetical protein M0Z30_08225 [Actinomycetota bacterium]|nr:hypothetical protein [Actinomycetota bacterium]